MRCSCGFSPSYHRYAGGSIVFIRDGDAVSVVAPIGRFGGRSAHVPEGYPLDSSGTREDRVPSRSIVLRQTTNVRSRESVQIGGFNPNRSARKPWHASKVASS